MNRIDARFAAMRAEGRAALIPYITAGYPGPADTGPLLDALVEAGADLIELGVPFSDPVADGPTIQRSSQRAIEGGTTLRSTLESAASFRARHDTPLVLFTYLNPVIALGLDRFLELACSAGVDALLLTDLPVGSDPELEETLRASELALIRLIAPTTRHERALEIARHAEGFLYYIARMGVTGATATMREELPREIASLREVTDAPIAVGFGISTAEQAAEVARVADGIVVGSALIDALDHGGVGAAMTLVRGISRVMGQRQG